MHHSCAKFKAQEFPFFGQDIQDCQDIKNQVNPVHPVRKFSPKAVKFKEGIFGAEDPSRRIQVEGYQELAVEMVCQEGLPPAFARGPDDQGINKESNEKC